MVTFEEDSTNNRYLFNPSHDLEEDLERGFGKSLPCRERGKIEKKVRVVGAHDTDDASLKHTNTLITVDQEQEALGVWPQRKKSESCRGP